MSLIQEHSLTHATTSVDPQKKTMKRLLSLTEPDKDSIKNASESGKGAIMYTGSCYCGQVKYRINGPIDYLVHCHCKPCRKVAGAAYYSAGFIAHSSFEITSGEGLVKTQENIWNQQNPNVKRFYCGECGGRLGVHISQDQLLNIAINTLDQELEYDIGIHINTESKAPWLKIPEHSEQYREFPPDISEQLRRIVHQ